ncbi:hypothetical protein K1719_036228 [Acacia pycnantha]|nr:hypothetical protein K1719_036228 [Acacia pycnantha]
MEVSCASQNISFLFTAIYGSPQKQLRKILWNDLQLLADSISSPWMLAGDFNAILHCSERRGGSINRAQGCGSFKDFIHSSGLVDLGSQGPKFTWRRGSLLMRLDRALCNSSWLHRFPSGLVNHLPKILSDHRPIAISINPTQQVRPSPKHFRFLAPWISHPDFQGIVQRIWDSGADLFSCLETFKEEIQQWNASSFGEIGRRKRRLLSRINGIQTSLEHNPSSDSSFLVDLEASLREDFEEVKRNFIAQLKLPDGTWLREEERLGSYARQYFMDLYALEDSSFSPLPLKGAFPSLGVHQALSLDRPVTIEEVKQSLFDMKPLKAPGSLEWEAF